MNDTDVGEKVVYRVFDRDGKVEGWLREGRGVAVWQNIALDSAGLGSYTFTPARVQKPDWRVELIEDGITDPTRFLFFKRCRVEAKFSETRVGREAAYRAIERLMAAPDQTSDLGVRDDPSLEAYERVRSAPMGRFYIRWTVEVIRYESAYLGYDPANKARVPYGPLHDGSEPQDRPLDTFSQYCVVRWEALEPAR